MRISLPVCTATAIVTVWLLAGCTGTTAGVAVTAPGAGDSDAAIVALLDTGNYPTTPNHPFGTAGSMSKGSAYEGRRMAEYVLGPWQAKETLRQLIPLPTVVVDDSTLDTEQVFDRPLADIAKAHGSLAGFASTRRSGNTINQPELMNVVLRFADPPAAAAAAGEMAAKAAQLGDSPRPIAVFAHPEATAWADTLVDGWVEMRSFVAHGPYVLYQHTAAPPSEDSTTPDSWGPSSIEMTLNLQTTKIDGFVPTDPAKFADLPTDPTGQLRSRTLWAADGHAPRSAGVWPPTAALHYEDDPVESTTLFGAAGVEAVAQMLAKVYQAHQSDGAARLVKQFTADTAAKPDVTPVTAIAGLPGAKCFVRPKGGAASTDSPTLRQFNWHFKCIARADRYAFITYSDTETDVKQQISAQYRILAGK